MPSPDDIVKFSPSQSTAPPADHFFDSIPVIRYMTAAPVPIVRVVATANQVLTGAATIDGVTLDDGDMVLLTAQAISANNGTWFKQTGAWIRSENPTGPGVLYSVLEGTLYEASVWLTRADGTIELAFQL